MGERTTRAAIVLLLCAAACSQAGGDEPGVSAPELMHLTVLDGGDVAHVIRPGTTVWLQADARDPAGGELTYEWWVAPGAGELDREADDRVAWRTGSPALGPDLVLTVRSDAGVEVSTELDIDDGPGPVFSGTVVDSVGEPVGGARVEVNGSETVTGEAGEFAFAVAERTDRAFVADVFKEGHARFSQVFTEPVTGAEWPLPPAATIEFDPTVEVTLVSALPEEACRGPLSSRVDWSAHIAQRAPVVSPAPGAATPVAVSAELAEALAIVETRTGCSQGFAVRLPANALVDADGEPPAGRVTATISTVDLMEPWSMPGDFTVSGPEGAYMESFGAGSVEIHADGKAYNLRPGTAAELTIPVDPMRLERFDASLPPTVPLLVYAASDGEWEEIGALELDAARTAYVGSVGHLSAFNADVVLSKPSCIRVDSSGIHRNFWLEVTIPQKNGPTTTRNFQIVNTRQKVHVVYGLPNDTIVALRPFRKDKTLVPLGTFLADTGKPQDPPKNPPAFPYGACKGSVYLFEVSKQPGTPAVPRLTKAQWLGTLKTHVRLTWGPNAKNVTGVDVYATTDPPNQANRRWERLDRVAATKTSFTTKHLVPCATYWFAVTAVNGNRSSGLSNEWRAVQDRTARVTVTAHQGFARSLQAGGPYTVGCTKRPGRSFVQGINGGVAVFDANRDGLVAGLPASSSGHPFPRGTSRCRNSALVAPAGSRFEPGGRFRADAIVYLRFNTWSTLSNVDQFVAIHYFTPPMGQDVLTGVLAGERRVTGGREDAVMEKFANPTTATLNGVHPRGSVPGYVTGTLHVALASNALPCLPFGNGLGIDFNAPFIPDDQF